MKTFFTTEATSEVSREDLEVLWEIESRVGRILAGVSAPDIDLFGVIFTIMNPKEMPPFPTGEIYRRSSKSTDLKVLIDFQNWMDSNEYNRAIILLKGASESLMKLKGVSPSSRNIIASALSDVADEYPREGIHY